MGGGVSSYHPEASGPMVHEHQLSQGGCEHAHSQVQPSEIWISETQDGAQESAFKPAPNVILI